GRPSQTGNLSVVSTSADVLVLEDLGGEGNSRTRLVLRRTTQPHLFLALLTGHIGKNGDWEPIKNYRLVCRVR
ncbi:MAG: hypothetical protein ABL958_10875, partial [Bdellovibrionia bacterium]